MFVIAPMLLLVDVGNIPNKLEALSEDIAGWKFFALAVVAAPLAEEIVFRFPLKYRSGALLIFCIFISGILYLLLSSAFSDQIAGTIALAFFLVGFLYVMIKGNALSEEKMASIFPYIFYLTAGAFALAHIGNYELDPTKWYFTPILVMPQLVLGLALGFVRLKYGLWACILMHALNNFIPMLVLLFAPESLMQ